MHHHIFADEQFSRDLARMCNDLMAEVKRNYPGRFGGFVAIPLPDVADAIEELRYGLEELGLDGACLFTMDPMGQYDPGLGMRNSLIEAPFEAPRIDTLAFDQGKTADSVSTVYSDR